MFSNAVERSGVQVGQLSFASGTGWASLWLGEVASDCLCVTHLLFSLLFHFFAYKNINPQSFLVFALTLPFCGRE